MKSYILRPGVMPHSCNLSIWKVEAGGSLRVQISLKWSETLSPKYERVENRGEIQMHWEGRSKTVYQSMNSSLRHSEDGDTDVISLLPHTISSS